MEPPAITAVIPHREPFLFLDEIVELSGRRVLARALADPQAPFFAGHYPDNPVMPGVLLCECCFQAGAYLIASALSRDSTVAGTPVITRVKEAKFKHMVRPGDHLDVEVVFDEVVNDVFFMTGRIRVHGILALRVEFAATRIEPGN